MSFGNDKNRQTSIDQLQNYILLETFLLFYWPSTITHASPKIDVNVIDVAFVKTFFCLKRIMQS